MFTIHLHNLLFNSFHGVYNEEKVLGGEYEVNAAVQVYTVHPLSITDTVNYVSIYAIIKKNMQTPVVLLETLINQITDEIFALDEKVKNVSIQIKKVNPPIENFQGSVGVSLTKSR